MMSTQVQQAQSSQFAGLLQKCSSTASSAANPTSGHTVKILFSNFSLWSALMHVACIDLVTVHSCKWPSKKQNKIKL